MANLQPREGRIVADEGSFVRPAPAQVAQIESAIAGGAIAVSHTHSQERVLASAFNLPLLQATNRVYSPRANT